MRLLLLGALGAVAGAVAFFSLLSSNVNVALVLSGFACVVAGIERWIDARQHRQMTTAVLGTRQLLFHTAMVLLTTFAAGMAMFVFLFATMVAP